LDREGGNDVFLRNVMLSPNYITQKVEFFRVLLDKRRVGEVHKEFPIFME
jgi:hypothetical protein